MPCIFSLTWFLITASSSIINKATAVKDNQNSHPWHQIYLDVEPANTSLHLEIIRALPLSTYRLSHERSGVDRVRIGVVGDILAEIVPDAVDLVAKRKIPPLEKGGEPITVRNVPVINDQMIFMYGLGATKEVAKRMEQLNETLSRQIKRVMNLETETVKLERILSDSSNDETNLRIRAAAAVARKIQTQLEIEERKVKDEEDYIDAQQKIKLLQIKYNEDLILERITRENNASRVRAKESMQLKFEASRKLEEERAYSAQVLSKIQHEKSLTIQKIAEDMKAKTAKIIAETKAHVERENEDVRLRKVKAEAEQRRLSHVAAINAMAKHIGSSFTAAAKHPKQAFTFISYLALLATGVFAAKETAKLFRLLIESMLGKPKLIRETSKKHFLFKIIYFFIDWVSYLFRLFTHKRKPSEMSSEEFFDDVILPVELKARILSLANSSRKVRQNNAPFRHALFYGPPGTGKTMVAKKLAQCIGMDYALMSGGDIGPLGPEAVTQLHNLFMWAKVSRNGVLLFIDEAETFLGDRSKKFMSESTHNALNAFLYNTGTEGKDFMLILATNRAEDLDVAVLDRCDESLLFPIPDATCRSLLLSQYFNKFVLQVEENNNKRNNSILSRMNSFVTKQHSFQVYIDHDVMNKHQLKHSVSATKGFSCREIGKLMIAFQSLVYSNEDGKLTKLEAEEMIKRKVNEHKAKHEMIEATSSYLKISAL